MDKRLELHSKLIAFLPNVYFQPPANIRLEYPCIIYNKSGKRRFKANDQTYKGTQQYKVLVIDRNPDSVVADEMEEQLQYCGITGYYTIDNLNHTSLTLYY